MTAERSIVIDEPMQEAINELKGMIRDKFPTAVFAAAPGEDPAGIYLDATVDTDEVDEVLDVVRERLFQLQVDEGLPIYM